MEEHIAFIRLAIQEANESKVKGNLPFGCVLVDGNGKIIGTGQNTIITHKDCLGHAEINLIRNASEKFTFDFLKTCTIYTTDEPCPMCTSAIYWSGIGRLVYGLSKESYYKIVGRGNTDFVFEMPCRELFQKGMRHVEVIGPLLEDEVGNLHRVK